MGGRGASSGISIYGKKYGTEYHTIKAKDENGKDVYLKSGFLVKHILTDVLFYWRKTIGRSYGRKRCFS